MSNDKPLRVLLAGRHVADLVPDGIGGCSLRYTPETVGSDLGRPLLSLTLSVREEEFSWHECKYFLDGLLPEDGIRRALADQARVAPADTFGLLGHYGWECAGAVQTMPDDWTEPGPPEIDWLTDDELLQAVRRLKSSPLGTGESQAIRVSLGGMQSKLLVCMDAQGRIGLPINGTPSTHIVKPAPLLEDGTEQWPGISMAEAFGQSVMSGAHDFGTHLHAADAQHLRIARTRDALVVKRFDRATTGTGHTIRLHQEDASQALGTHEKYQNSSASYAQASLVAISRLVDRWAKVPADALQQLAEWVLLNAALGNCDAHARNFSFMLNSGAVSPSPAYDTVPTAIWPGTTRELALRIGEAAFIDDLTRENFRQEFASWGMRERRVESIITKTLAAASRSIEATRADFAADGRLTEAVSRAAHQSAARVADWS